MTALSAAFGALVQADAPCVAGQVATGEHASALVTAQALMERAAFRLASLAFSAWWAAGAPEVDAWPVEVRDGHLALGSARQALEFCTKTVLLLPAGKLYLPLTVQMADVVQAIESASAGHNARQLRSRRFDLTGAVAAAKRTKPRRTLAAAIGETIRLRNKTAHVAGRSELWPDEHPDYAATLAPLLGSAVDEMLTHPEVGAALEGLVVARLEAVSRTPDRARLPMYRFTPDAAGVQAAFFTSAAGLAGVHSDDALMREVTELPAGELERLRPEFVVRITREPAQVLPVMLFFDLGRGVPRHPVSGDALPLGTRAIRSVVPGSAV